MLESMVVDESVLAASDADPGKRKRESSDLLEYLERSEERTQEQSRKDQEVTAAILQTMPRMDDNATHGRQCKRCGWAHGANGVGAGGLMQEALSP
ncbi:uncharacterized protein LOC115415717 isoform X1 [Scomber scombrus]|uniref:Uncharacterized protein LOC115415717 isoform X1 n=1 Tax=Scomber scombrus TaxID=13677 RepID=A0AAV1Q5Q1_SCOSC